MEDYDCHDKHRLYDHRFGGRHKKHPYPYPYPHCWPPPHDCHDDHHHHHHHHHCCEPQCCHDSCCTREFDVAVVLCVDAKVFADRPVLIKPSYAPPAMPFGPVKYPAYPSLPFKPKG